uniref:Uncharacterized protein n=1 Tax=Glossina palpalis gambiensis TaxID=67801 RepID=A0A1B0AKT2_9MUSC
QFKAHLLQYFELPTSEDDSCYTLITTKGGLTCHHVVFNVTLPIVEHHKYVLCEPVNPVPNHDSHRYMQSNAHAIYCKRTSPGYHCYKRTNSNPSSAHARDVRQKDIILIDLSVQNEFLNMITSVWLFVISSQQHCQPPTQIWENLQI